MIADKYGICNSILFTGEVIKTGDMKCLMGEGMPLSENPLTRGRLIIKFNVVFPATGSLPANRVQELKMVLPSQEELFVPDNAEKRILKDFEPNHKIIRVSMKTDDADDDEAVGGSGETC